MAIFEKCLGVCERGNNVQTVCLSMSPLFVQCWIGKSCTPFLTKSFVMDSDACAIHRRFEIIRIYYNCHKLSCGIIFPFSLNSTNTLTITDAGYSMRLTIYDVQKLHSRRLRSWHSVYWKLDRQRMFSHKKKRGNLILMCFFFSS